MPVGAELELVKLTKRYGPTLAVDGINLRVSAGSYCCLLGPSGCGKTTTLRMIAGHEAASGGDITLGAQNITGLVPAQRGTAMMFQSYALFPHLSVLDNVAFAPKMRASEVPVLALEDPRSDARAKLSAEIALAKTADHAEAIVLGCAGMADLAAALSAEHGLPVVDGVAAAVGLIEMLARLGLKTSKLGGYATPPPKTYSGSFVAFAPVRK